MKNKFFKIEHGHFFYTNDEWKTFKYSEDNSFSNGGFEEENDQMKICEIRLKASFGVSVGSLIVKEFDLIDSEYYKIKNKHLNKGNGYGDHFEIFAISNFYGISYEKVINNYLVAGNLDGGVDAIVYTDKEVHIYQIKLNKLQDDNSIENMVNNIDEYIKTRKIENKDAKHLSAFLDRHYERDIKGKELIYRTISTNGQRSDNISTETIYSTFIQKQVERHRMSFSNSIEIPKNDDKESVTYSPDNNHEEVFIFSNADKLVDSLLKHVEYEENLDYLFVDNVRGRLNKNTTLIQTIKNEPSMFCFYNNGISIIGHFVAQKRSPVFIVSDPLIINGQQTMISLISAKKEGIDISEVYVPVFLKNVSNNEELKNIAKYNNTQAKISSLDLLSIDPNLRKIQSDLLDNFISEIKNNKRCYYLDLVRSGKNKHKDTARQVFENENIIPVVAFVKLYSVIKNPDNLGVWKNNLDQNIKRDYQSGFDNVNKEEARKICDSIRLSKEIIKGNNDYRIADLTIQFLLYIGYEKEDIVSIVDTINRESENRGDHKADAFRQKSTFQDVKNVVDKLGLQNLFETNNG